MPCRYAVLLIYARQAGPVAAFEDPDEAAAWALARHGRLAEVIDLREDAQRVHRTLENDRGSERTAEGA